MAGDRLEIGPATQTTAQRLPDKPQLDAGPIRVIAGPQGEFFTAAAWADFLGSEFTVTREADRMGLRLDGRRLAHDPALGADIVSDAVTPGTIQVPGDGKPIVLLADCQTVGGYPKIATVASVDLPRLGRLLRLIWSSGTPRLIMRLIQRIGKAPRLYVQVNTGEEPQKAGVLPAETEALIAYARKLELPLMGVKLALRCVGLGKHRVQCQRLVQQWLCQ